MMDPAARSTNERNGSSEGTWGWNRATRISLAVLILLFFVGVVVGYRRRPVRMDEHFGVREGHLRELETLIDPNTAEVASLIRIPGIGEKTAQAIVAYRVEQQKQQPGKAVFRRLEDLLSVRGIGKKTLEEMRPWLLLPEVPVILPHGLEPAREVGEGEIKD